VFTVGDLLDELAAALAGPGVPPARGLARDLIAGVLDQPKFWPSANQQRAVSDAERSPTTGVSGQGR
jgi:hypothetical protein